MKRFYLLLFVALTVFSASAQDDYPDFDMKEQPFPPLITFSSQLANLNVTTEGRNMIALTIAFSPTKTTSGEPLDYRKPYYHIKIYNNGTFVEDVKLKERSEVGIFRMFSAACIEGDYECFKPLNEGKVKYETYLGNLLVNVFEFDVVKKTTDDIYAKQKNFLFQAGPWQKYALISTQESDGNLIFTKYFINDTAGPRIKKTYSIVAELYRDGALVSLKPSPYSLIAVNEDGKVKFETTFNDATTKQYVKVQSLKDGKYTVKITVNGKAQSYDFTVAAGKVVPPANMDLKAAKDYSTILFAKKDMYFIPVK